MVQNAFVHIEMKSALDKKLNGEMRLLVDNNLNEIWTENQTFLHYSSYSLSIGTHYCVQKLFVF